MNKIQVLDCTLRDGGYCNQWKFGNKNIKSITEGLVQANIDIIECGFLTNKVRYDSNVSKFTSVEQIQFAIPQKKNGKLFVAMINYGEYDLSELPECDNRLLDGIRVAFHKRDRKEALEWCRIIKKKGYKVFVQAMVSSLYTDKEFLEMIEEVNKIEPYVFYIVDSFGMMKHQELCRLFYLVQHNLSEEIWIGFHSHNNLQLAYSNAQTLVNMPTKRNLIIDSSVYGMGRGAGNLNTELFVDYLNEHLDKQYHIKPLLVIIDEILNLFYQKNYWGYSLPNYLSAIHNAHPNYAGYLDDKKTLTVEAMNEIFDRMSEEKRVTYDESYIEQLYMEYMDDGDCREKVTPELKERLNGKKVLLIAPGKSSNEMSDVIVRYAATHDVVVISVNMSYQHCPVDYIFVSNKRRFRELGIENHAICIATSNIDCKDVLAVAKYSELLNNVEMVKDNAGMMALKWLNKMGVKEVAMAGFDGYSHNQEENYLDDDMEIVTKNEVLDKMNEGIKSVIDECCKKMKITFVTDSKYVL